jgi:hypothetical protein
MEALMSRNGAIERGISVRSGVMLWIGGGALVAGLLLPLGLIIANANADIAENRVTSQSQERVATRAAEADPTDGSTPDGRTYGTLPNLSSDDALSRIPDYIAIAYFDRPGVAGYASKEDVAAIRPAPVYAQDLTTVVGQFIPGKGFIPVGVDPDSVQTTAERAGVDIDQLRAEQLERLRNGKVPSEP